MNTTKTTNADRKIKKRHSFKTRAHCTRDNKVLCPALESERSIRSAADWINAISDLLEAQMLSGHGLKELLSALERNMLVKVLSNFNGNQVQAARYLRLKPTTLNEKLKKYDIAIAKMAVIDAGQVKPSID